MRNGASNVQFGARQLHPNQRRFAAAHLYDRVRSRLSPCSRPDPKDGVGDGHAVLSAEGVQQGHGDAEQRHAEDSAASPAPQAPDQADSVHGRPGDLRRTRLKGRGRLIGATTTKATR